MIQERLNALRTQMRKRGIALYLVPTADFHESEYVGAHFKAREYMTGFTGSAGTAVITLEEAFLWTDGRYFVQAAQQLQGTTIKLCRTGEEGVPTVDEFVEQALPEGGCLGFDAGNVNGKWGSRLEEMVKKKHGSLHVDEDLVGLIWEDRPPLSAEPASLLDIRFAGKSTKDKLCEVRKVMEEKKADVHLLSSLCDIAWLLNVRGRDISYVPVVLSFLALTKERCIWFVQKKALGQEVRDYLKENGIETEDYGKFYDYVSSLTDRKILLDSSVVNYRILSSISASCQIEDSMNPTVRMRAVKNPVELDNIRKSHVKDAVAMCRFMYWLKKNVGQLPMTELSAAGQLKKFRASQEGFLDLSFETISAYGGHGAVVHYAVTPETDVPLKPEGFLLVDSGGHYLEGTTDVTRTFALGPVTEEMKENYTRVLRANLNLANARFLYGCNGCNLDVLAREPLWEAGLDYRHGTGHGVGYLLNVHEGPNGFRCRITEDVTTLEEGMVTTDEPGLYLEGGYGIRLENELLCRRGEKNEFGQFMYFENLTFVPFDLDAIDADQMSEEERKRLDRYHEMVYRTVSPYLSGEELAWLKEATRSISRG